MVNITPYYNSPHWRPLHINSLPLAELDSYDIYGLSAMIYRTVPHRRIRYILSTTGAGRPKLSRHGDKLLSSWDYVFIQNEETVRTWLYSNPVLNNPLEMIVYWYRDQYDNSQNTLPLMKVNYLTQGEVRH